MVDFLRLGQIRGLLLGGVGVSGYRRFLGRLREMRGANEKMSIRPASVRLLSGHAAEGLTLRETPLCGSRVLLGRVYQDRSRLFSRQT